MLYSMFAATAENYGQQTAVISPTETLSFQQIQQRVLTFAAALYSNNLQIGDRVVLLLPNGPDFIAATFAIAYCGGVVVPLNTAYKSEELCNYLADAQPRIVICDDVFGDSVRAVIDQLTLSCTVLNTSQPSESCSAPAAEVEPSACALYQYSTGSTGKPKRVMRSFSDLVNEATNFKTSAQTSTEDRILAVAPFFHAHGFGNCVLAGAASGATLVTLPNFKSRKKVMTTLRERRITIFPGVPFMFSILADAPSLDKEPLPELRLAFSAGAALDENTFQKFLAKYDVPIRQLYGSTETGAMSLNTGSTAGDKWRSVGKALANVHITIRDETDALLPANVTGEIVIHSNAMTRGYANLAEATRESFRDNQFYTGDLGYLDTDGYLTITGRKKFFINAAGNKVDPGEIEQLIAAHPNVGEVVVVGVKSEYGLEVIKAAVVAKGPITEQDIRDCCIGKVADFKVPRIIEFREEIPKSPLGKVLRKYLIE